MEALGINSGYLLMQIFGITILILVLNALLYKPMIRTLEERKARIAKGLEDARQASIARDNAEAEAEKIKDAARAEANKMRQEATTGAEETAKGVIAQANEEAKQIVASSRADAETERTRILGELRNQVAAVSMAAANKLVGEAMDEKRQRALLADFFAKVPDSVSSLSGDSAQVVSALPLTDDEKEQVKKSISASNVEFKVDPSILGGLIVRVGDEVVDNSVSSQMTAMSDALK